MSNNELGKYCYEIVLGNDDVEKPLDVLTSHLDTVSIRDNARKYSWEVLGNTDEHFSKLWRKNVNKVIGYLTRTNLGYEYLNANRNHDAHRLISKFIKSDELSVDGICKKEGLSLSDFEEYANVIRNTDPKLYELYKNKIGNKKHKKNKHTKKELEIQKYCYDLLKHNNWSTNKISDTHNLSIADIRVNALIYATDTLGLTKDEFYYEKYINGTEGNEKNTVTDKKYYVLYEELCDTTDSDEIIATIGKYYDSYDYKKFANVNSKVEDYVNRHRKSELKTLPKDLKRKIELFSNAYKKENRKVGIVKALNKIEKNFMDNDYPEIEKYFIDYINSPYNAAVYRRETKVNSELFSRRLSQLKKRNFDLYEKVMQKEEELHKRYLNDAKEIINSMKENPYFDVFDYVHFTKLDLADLRKELSGELSADDSRLINSLNTIKYDGNLYRDNPKLLLNMNYYLPVGDGSIYEVGEEGKEEVYNYFVDHDLPLSIEAYKAGLKRYMNGTLYEYNDKKTKTKRK